MVEKMITIAGRKVGRQHPPFIIAEMSGNHNKSLARALEVVEVASKIGAHGYVRPLIKIEVVVSEASA